MKIRCPKCGWEPEKTSKWRCTACEKKWHTFDTRGVCPACEKEYNYTQCQNLDCTELSHFSDWFEK